MDKETLEHRKMGRLQQINRQRSALEVPDNYKRINLQKPEKLPGRKNATVLGGGQIRPPPQKKIPTLPPQMAML